LGLCCGNKHRIQPKHDHSRRYPDIPQSLHPGLF
jgi:hypothetical protein